MSRAAMPAIPPKITPASPAAPGSSLATMTIALAGAGVLAACAVLYFFNPSQYGFYPICEFHELTGLNCPGCGGTRAAYDLLHGQWIQALHENALFVLSLAALMGRGGWLVLRRLRGRTVSTFLPPNVLWAFLVAAILFTVLRNLPFFSFLSP